MFARVLGCTLRILPTRKNALSWKVSPLGKSGCIEVPIYPDEVGRVKAAGSWWPARCQDGIVLQPGEMVKIVGIENITLLVTPQCGKNAVG